MAARRETNIFFAVCGDMRAADSVTISKKGAHGGNMVSPVKPSRRRR
jgi:hypothetical protein